LAIAALATGIAVLLISGDEGDGEAGSPAARSPGAASPPAPSPDHQRHRQDDRSTQRQVQEAVEQSPSPRLDPAQRQVARVARAYVAALNARDGERTCGLFVAGALSEVDFPRERESCARSLSASIGYSDPRGFPVYERSRIARIPAVAIDGASARVTATTVTSFAGNREPSVEDDLIYLVRGQGEWRIVKPSATLYRAIGIGDIPPTVLAPP
jgi:hypothetical protein